MLFLLLLLSSILFLLLQFEYYNLIVKITEL